MIVYETRLRGVYVLEMEPRVDERGYFARVWCKQEFAEHGLRADFVQCSVSYNELRGTLRGMHYQAEPFAETKLVRCTRGGIYDVALDLRADSPTFLRWVGVELTPDNRRSLYIPENVAHGFQTLESRSEVLYEITPCYMPEASRVVRFDDPAFGIEWPLPPVNVSERDRGCAFFQT